MRLKPRLNPDVNQYWICDSGRYNYRFIDEHRVQYPQINNEIISWDQAIETMAQKFSQLQKSGQTNKIGVIASAQLTNEDLFVIRKFFKDGLKQVSVDYRVSENPGDSDDFLIKADKNPNTAGANVILPAEDSSGAGKIIDQAKRGELEILYVFGQDLIKLYGKDVVSQIASKVKLFVWQGSTINETCSYAHVILPSAVYAEKDGTFTNVQRRVQRIWQAFLPIADAKVDWEIIMLLAQKVGVNLTYKDSETIFKELSSNVAAFSEMTYEKIGEQGAILKG